MNAAVLWLDPRLTSSRGPSTYQSVRLRVHAPGALAPRAKVLAALAAWVVGLLPRVAYACPVCFYTENEANRVAYLVTAVFMTALPFVVVGGILLWVVRRARATDAAVTPGESSPVQEVPRA